MSIVDGGALNWSKTGALPGDPRNGVTVLLQEPSPVRVVFGRNFGMAADPDWGRARCRSPAGARFVAQQVFPAAFRRRGVARALLEELFKECRVRDCKSVQVEVGQGNAAARRLYARFGLVPHQDDRILLSGVPGCG